MSANLNSKTAAFLQDTETVVITRRVPNASSPGTFTISPIYSGPCDFQSLSGSMYYNPGGPVDQAQARVIIDPSSTGVLPDVEIGDTVAIGDQLYHVTGTSGWTFAIPHLELSLSDGPALYKGPK